MPLVRAVAKYRNGDIRLTFHSAWAASLLTSEADHWLPVFSSLLQLRAPTFRVVMHRVSTSFELGTGLPNGDDISERDNNIAELVDANKMQSWDVARVQWIGRRSVDELPRADDDGSPQKAHALQCADHRPRTNQIETGRYQSGKELLVWDPNIVASDKSETEARELLTSRTRSIVKNGKKITKIRYKGMWANDSVKGGNSGYCLQMCLEKIMQLAIYGLDVTSREDIDCVVEIGGFRRVKDN
ncbi:hypothetical protein B0H14DRAFT_3573806 [Mycena olivaceomarginata]|nr:hypothetical protein B0H14DRAFT_3573806 [Mycena olivaceomarginata]